RATPHGTLQGIKVETIGSQDVATKQTALLLNQNVDVPARLQAPADQPYTQKYWLAKTPSADVYQIDDQQLIGLPDNPPAAQMRVLLTVEGTPVELVRPVQHRYADRAQGERVRPVVVVPAVAVNLPVPVAVFPDGGAKRVQVSV